MSTPESGRECCRPQRTELVWEGKRTQVERIALPFQVVETINVSRATREDTPLLTGLRTNPAPDANPEGDGWRNKLIWGDNKYVLASLLEEFAGKIDLIYIDPPFDIGDNFSFRIQIGEMEVGKEPSIIEETAYRDTWGRGVDSYLQMMYDRLVLMRDLLTESGSIYVHMDWHVGHYVKLVLDEVFGRDRFQNEIVWKYTKYQMRQMSRFAANSDRLLFYSKGDVFTFHPQTEPLDKPKRLLVKHWDKQTRSIQNLKDDSGRVQYMEIDEAKVDDVWVLSYIAAPSHERVGFPTQKPETLLSRIIRASSREGDLVLDCFIGSGTTAVVAEKLGRRWIGCDLSRFAIHVTRKRLLDIPNCRPFEVLNLGKYERQHWQVTANGDSVRAYLDFIVQLYRAERVQGFTHLHGRKAGRMVHVGATDAPVTLSEITELLDECAANHFRGLDVLGWEWEMGLHDLVPVEARKRGIDLRLLTIPREVMDKRAVEAGDVHFYELAYLDAEVRKSGTEVQVGLRNFIIPNLELIPQDVRDKIKRWSDYVDFWAVDWDYQGDTFHNAWQSYRTRKHPALRLESDPHPYEAPGRYQVMIKVIDIFGNDTTKLIPVTVP
jgi:DNA modification methylase